MTVANSALEKLREEYQRSETCDEESFAEMRSNILIVAGEHYSRRFSNYWNRIRDTAGINAEQKLRLTKNHIYKIMRLYANSIVNYAPGVAPMPQDPKSLQDMKGTALHHGVMKYAKEKYRIKEKTREWADDFTNIGEVGVKIFFDPSLGKPVGYAPLTDQSGNVVTDDLGRPKASDKLIRRGEFVFETFYCMNLLRSADVKEVKASPFLTLRKMVSVKDMKAKYKDQPDKAKLFVEAQDRTYMVFDANTGDYGSTKGQTMVRETFYRPCAEYPNGYFYYWVDEGIFEEGELPFGIFPIAHALFDKFQNCPRGKSQIKVLRPFQVEMNRAASKEAEHQVTLGDDKIIMQSGTTMQQGETLPGIRGVKINGPAPTILQGRSGAQFGEFCMRQLDEMYKASLVQEENEEQAAQVDPFTLLYKAASQKKKFSLYTERFEQFLVDVWTIYLELARHYLSDDELIQAVGESEAGNIEEFRAPKSENLGFILKLEPQTEDLESKFGKALTLNQALQYIGTKLEREDIGRILQNHPYVNTDEIFSDLTLDYDSSQNFLLAMDRGQIPEPNKYDDPKYMIKRLTNRTRKPDFQVLPDQIKANYARVIQWYEKTQAEQEAAILAAEAEFIPTGGGLVAADMYVQDPLKPTSQKRVRIPYESLNWLLQKLEAQGSGLANLEDMQAQNLAEIAGQIPLPRQASYRPSRTGQPKQPEAVG